MSGDRERVSRSGRALLIGGLLVFGAVFGGAVLALHSGTLRPGAYSKGAFVFTEAYLFGGGGNELLVVTADRNNDPLPGQEVRVYLTNSSGTFELFNGKTDNAGVLQARFYVPEQPGASGARERTPEYDGRVLLTVVAGRETIQRRLEVYNQPSYSGAFSADPGASASKAPEGGERPSVQDRVPPKLYLTMDKPRYQPGQTMRLRTLSFWPGAANTENVTYEISDPSGNKLFRTTLVPNKFGVTFLDYPLSDILPLGEYRVSASTASALTVKSVPVERYVLPKFGIEFRNVSSPLTLDRPVTGEIYVSYFFGKPVEGSARITARLYSSDMWYWYETETGAVDRIIGNATAEVREGRCAFTLPPAREFISYTGYSWIDKYRQYNLDIRAEVTDTGGHTEAKNTTIVLSPEAFYATAILETATPGQPFTAQVLVRDPLGAPVQGAHVAPSLKKGSAKRPLPEVVTDQRGIARVTFIYNKEQTLELKVWTGDPSAAETISYSFWDISAVKVVPEKRFYNAGETARVTVYADPQDDLYGVAGLAFVSVLVEGEPVIEKSVALVGGKGDLSFRVTEEMVPSIEIEARKLSVMSYESYYYGLYEDYYYYYYFRGGSGPAGDRLEGRYTVATDRAAIGVGIANQLNVTITPSKQQLRPGEEVELLFNVLNGTDPVSAALAVAIVDEALLAMGGESAFAEIRQDLQKDPGFEQYSIYSYVWGGIRAVEMVMPIFRSDFYSDYRPDAGILTYSSEVRSVGTAVSGGDTEVSRGVLLGVAALGVAGYFGVIWLGIRFRKIALALLASLLILAAAVPAALYFFPQHGPAAFSDTSQPISFTGYTRAGSESYYGDMYRGQAERSGGAPPQPAKGEASAAGNGSAGMSYQPRGIIGPGREVTVRTWFPELWYWNPLIVTAEDGSARLVLRAPDSITTWRVEALGSTVDGRVGVGNGSLVVFQPFFVDPDLPASIVRNDRFTFRVMVFNYESKERTVLVELSPSNWYRIISSPTSTVVVGANSVSSVAFTIQALRVGVHGLRVTGTTDGRQDIVVREIAVEPDGRLVEDIRNGILENDDTARLTFSLDARRIAGSEMAYVKLQAGVESVILDGADQFIEIVSGCGEQSTSRLSVDIVAYENYMKGRPDPANVTRYQNIINMGIQHEAQYLTSNTGGHGRAIVWHQGEAPDIWLTAWALQAYKDLQDTGFLADSSIIPDLQTYLLSTQGSDGHWEIPDVGHWSLNSALKSQKLASTAYIARALAYSGLSGSSDALQRAVRYIEANIGSASESFTIALCLDALEMAGGSRSVRSSLVQRLAASVKEGASGAKYWEYAEKEPGWYWCSDNTVETTGYAVMALARAGSSPELVRAGAKYLVLQRNAGGYWGSTHNTAVAFTALNSLDEITPLRSMTVEVRADGALVGSASFNDENKDMTYMMDLRPWFLSSEGNVAAREVSISLRSSGEGGVFYHIYTKQNIEWAAPMPLPPPELELSVSYDNTTVSLGDVVVAEAELVYRGPAGRLRMVLVELRAPTGFVLDESDFRELLSEGRISFYEFRGSDRALVYLDGVERERPVKLDYTLTAMRPAASLLQHVRAWDMYNTTLMVELGAVGFEATG